MVWRRTAVLLLHALLIHLHVVMKLERRHLQGQQWDKLWPSGIEGSRAVDVLLMPSEVGTQIVHYVNEALKYAFEKLR